eukprot:2760319-Amphidinium_carterae.1
MEVALAGLLAQLSGYLAPAQLSPQSVVLLCEGLALLATDGARHMGGESSTAPLSAMDVMTIAAVSHL